MLTTPTRLVSVDVLSLRFFGVAMFVVGIFLFGTLIGGALCVCGGLATCTSFVIKKIRRLRETLLDERMI